MDSIEIKTFPEGIKSKIVKKCYGCGRHYHRTFRNVECQEILEESLMVCIYCNVKVHKKMKRGGISYIMALKKFHQSVTKEF